MSRWAYENPVRILASDDVSRDLHDVMPGAATLVVTTAGGTRRGWTQRILSAVDGQTTVFDGVTANPDLDYLDQTALLLRGQQFDAIVAIGGGSVLDTAKVLSVTIPSDLYRPLDAALRTGGSSVNWERSIPVIAIPTTSGSGAEVTPFATVWDSRDRVKRSLATPAIRPKVALLDPSLTLTLSRSDTLYPALDALSHSLESLWNKNRNTISLSYGREALKVLIHALPAVLVRSDDVEARGALQEASMLAGLAIAHTRTALAHSVSYPLTSRYGVPHGLACSFSLVSIIESYRGALPLDDKLVSETVGLLKSLELPRLVMEFASPEQIIALSSEMIEGDRSSNFPLPIDHEDVQRLVAASLTS